MKPAEADYSGLSENQDFCGWRVRAVYTNHLGAPVGARFVHPNGLPADLLRLNCLPQLSICFQTLPAGDGGEAHALEHIVLGKGRQGKRLSMMFDACLAENTAATYPDITNYQFSCAGGKDAFLRLAERFFSALLEPDFSDEEARREIYNVDAAFSSSGYALEEKGTVYNEMLAASEKPSYALWRALAELAYGANHPLARESGGAPEAMRGLSPALVRAFHAANYRNMARAELIAALPPEMPPGEFLEKLSAWLPQGAGGGAQEMPDFSPAASGEMVIAPYPSGDAQSPQDAVFAWKPARRPGYGERLAFSLFMEILAGGETSYLHRDLVDSSSHKCDCGAAAVDGFAEDAPSNIAGVYAAALPPENISRAMLSEMREVITARAQWMASGAGAGEMREKAVSLLSSRRRMMLKFLDNPPRFGDRGGGIGWHRHLRALEETGGFIRPVAQLEAIDVLERRINSGQNIWRETAAKNGLDEIPFCCSSKPDSRLLERRAADKAARLDYARGELETRFNARGEEPLKLKFEESRRDTLRLESELDAIPRPPFVESPPLTLDDGITVFPSVLPCGAPALAATVGETPFTDITLFFNLAALKPEDCLCAPLLSSALADTGVKTASGQTLDYAAMIERWRAEIFALSSFVSSNTATGRAEIAISASAARAEEIPAAAAWLENCLLRHDLSAGNTARLRDIIDESVQEIRGMFNHSEEHWARDAASGFFHSDDALFMSLHSPFTELFHLERLRVMLADDAAPRALEELAASGELRPGAPLPRWLLESLEWNIRRFPPQSARGDTAFLAGEFLRALRSGPEGALGGLKAALGRLLDRNNARAAVAGSPANAAAALRAVDAVLSKLPAAAERPAAPAGADIVLSNVRKRSPAAGRLVHGAFVNAAGSSGVILTRAEGVSYRDTDEEKLWRFLALKLLGGGGPHGLFMKTWDAGLAYSNGIGANPASGKFSYYAERCPDLPLTLEFAASVAEKPVPPQPYLADYALSNCFGDYRGGDSPSARGYAAACDFADGLSPEIVRRFKTALLSLGARPDAPAELSRRAPLAAGRALPLPGRPLSKEPGAKTFAIAPEAMALKYGRWLEGRGETEPLVLVYPRDFWVY
ncbi:MAG: hypothetical protein WC421_03990 [Elusimicrobiales bacterium]